MCLRYLFVVVVVVVCSRVFKACPVTFPLALLRQSCFPGGSAGEESVCNVGDLGLIPGLGRSPGEGNSYALQYCGLENIMDCIVHEVAKSGTIE